MSGRKGTASIAVAAAVAGLTLLSGIACAQSDTKPDAAAAPAAAPQETITPPTDPVAHAAFDVLDKYCSRCHQTGRLVGRDRPAKQFGNILRLDQLAANPHYIHPGNPLDSFLVRQVLDKQMPFDVYQDLEVDKPSPGEADIKALEAWVNSLGDSKALACKDHRQVGPNEVVRFMVDDLDKQLERRRSTTRYLTMTHLTNACADPEALKVYRQATIKFLNSVNLAADPVKLEPIDPDNSIFRFNLVDIGWSAQDWDSVIAVYPYNTQPDSEFARSLAAGTRTPQSFVRADWFVFTASQPPLYDIVLKLPNTFQGLTQQQGIDVEGDIRNFVAQRAAFQKSGVSQNNRLIERHPARSGYFWTSYDFSGNRDHQSLFDFPLGPSAAGFHHDGGETIFSLPDGFQAYYLNKATGERLDKGPTSIVRDASRKDFSVTNGISCMGCHDLGIRQARDEIRDFVLSRRTFPVEVRDAVDGLYPPADKMKAFLDQDTKRFTDAEIRAGIQPTLQLNGVEMINAFSKYYEGDVDAATAAAEFGLTLDEFNQAAADVDPRLRPIVRRLSQSSVPRDQFEQAFRDLATSLTDQRAVQIANARPIATSSAVAKHADDLALISDASVYRVGDSPVFTVTASRDCYLTLIDLDDKGDGVVLLPNGFQRDNHIKAGVAVRFPAADATFKFRLKDAGTETITAVCAQQPGGGDRIAHDFSHDQFTPVNDYNRVLARSIAVEPAGPRPVAGSAEDIRPSLRAAIKLQVR